MKNNIVKPRSKLTYVRLKGICAAYQKKGLSYRKIAYEMNRNRYKMSLIEDFTATTVQQLLEWNYEGLPFDEPKATKSI